MINHLKIKKAGQTKVKFQGNTKNDRISSIVKRSLLMIRLMEAER